MSIHELESAPSPEVMELTDLITNRCVTDSAQVVVDTTSLSVTDSLLNSEDGPVEKIPGLEINLLNTKLSTVHNRRRSNESCEQSIEPSLASSTVPAPVKTSLDTINAAPSLAKCKEVSVETIQFVGTHLLDKKSSTICKICHSGGSCEQLIQPCLCKGTVGNVHLTCLERWLNETSVDQCELCLFQFTADHTRRYTMWRSLVIWARAHRNLLLSDLIVMTIMTIVVGFLLTSLVMGLIVFRGIKTSSSMDLWGHCMIAVFITIVVLGYALSMYTIIKDNFQPWYRWWKNCHNIRLNRELLTGPLH